ncbi:hypothetical protein ACT453_31030, partial [Bacillus sp. D-CC]
MKLTEEFTKPIPSKKLFLPSTNFIVPSSPAVVEVKNNFLEGIGLVNSSVNTDGTNIVANEITKATNAEYTINGIRETSKSNKIDKIPGLTINLEKETTEPIKLT